MLALAGRPLGISCEFLAEEPTLTCEDLGKLTLFSKDRETSVIEFAERVDVITFESENIDPLLLRGVPSHKIAPALKALATARDRLNEKEICKKLGIQTAPYFSVSTPSELIDGINEVGFPCILKTRTMGYDGKGQWRLNSFEDAHAASQALDWLSMRYILEGVVPFQREVSIIGVRDRNGMTETYRLTENKHKAGILRKSQVRIEDEQQGPAEEIFAKIAGELAYVGVLAIELFESDSKLIANEIAPRVHNSGHWTIEGATTSQFENHLRAICGMPLGSCASRGASTMLNIIGNPLDQDYVLGLRGAHLHDYRKSPRPGRKLGHVTVLDIDTEDYASTIESIEQRIIDV
jgi:5-(carboxyamino)imidazole ribonucleotide synthase